ncbi:MULTISPECIES: helix-turn-helix transcriptional regulator [Streptomyces]|uniref:Helix-turn-helix transcriptional regulator n=2 Tax=Streptomyces TaxID=1883 RepID=A0A0W7WS85_9ACTN|nr:MULTISPECIES: helix-turn-helix transcriptional regulator [Streptomyces]KUF13367.1 helix-turn-helix transcriptional regulator [Streptomyces silvensis]MVO86528.1 helix-turn-helix transcriptional regulator [Streptomyces typhae]
MTTEPRPHPHGPDELCEAGSALYARALREGRVRHQEAGDAPCLIDFGLLHPDIEDMAWLRPTAPAVALPQLLRSIEDHIARHREREERLTALFEPLMALDARQTSGPEPPEIMVLEGFERINVAITQAMTDARHELLTVQPGGARSPEILADALPREQEFLSRGCRMRTLYQHTTRHSLPAQAHYEQLDGDVEVRTLNEVTERMVVLDHSVAFIPASKDRTVALEVRQPAIVDYLITTFERLWHLATPMFPHAAQLPAENGVTTRQRAIAELLVEGLTDTEIATRLGMNVRTAREHIAKLAAILGSNSRAQLGYLIGQSGILDQNH